MPLRSLFRGCANRPNPLETLGAGEWRSLVAHLLWEQRVAGSNPVSPTIVFKCLLVTTAVPGGGFAT